jgi:hypothetical protein
MPALKQSPRNAEGPHPVGRPNWAVVGMMIGLTWWLSMIGSVIAADLRERQSHRPHAAAPQTQSRQASN